MSGLEWVIGASAVIWLSIAAYVAFMAYSQKDIDRRLALLEEEHEQS